MLLKLKSLEIEGFRSFRERSKFTFPDQGMVLVNGRYSNRDVSSGSGKSTMAIAIAYALGYSSLPATELKNRDSKNLFVQLTLSDGSCEYTITRNPKLQVSVGDTISNGKVAEEKLQQLLKIPSQLAEALTYRAQREHGLFVNSTDSENKEFLSTLLGISEIETAYEAFQSEKDSLSRDKENLGTQIALHDQILTEGAVSDDAESAAKNLFEETGLRLQQLSSNDETNKLRDLSVIAKREIDRANAARSESEVAKHNNMSLRDQIVKIQQALDTLKSNICPTCRREWFEGQNTIEEKQQQIKSMLDKMAVNIAIVNNAQPIIESIPILNTKYQEIITKIGQLKSPVTDAERAHQSAKANLMTLTDKKNRYETIRIAAQEKRNKILDIDAKLDIITHAAAILSRNGFLGAIFDEILTDIESRANDMMSQIPNIDAFSISISSTNISKAGSAKKTINFKLSQGGHEVSVKTLSGGQMCALELCTDLAVSEAIRSRSGSPLGWIVLDESMDGLDLESKKAALKVVRSKVKGQILVIDHSTEIKENFESVIDIIFDGRESRLVGQS